MASLLEKLQQYTASAALPMHMPGHKRNLRAFPWLSALGGALDITEISGFDNLNAPEGCFLELEKRVAALWGAKTSICLVGGSTAGILAAVSAALEPGGALLISRASHKSVYHAAELNRAELHYLLPAMDLQLQIPVSVSPDQVDTALSLHPQVKLVVITSPTYEGILSDIRGIAAVCHAHGALLLVDEAHGAHLGFGRFPESAATLDADLVVQSLHKTLPALTQTAVLHICSTRLDPAVVRRYAAMYQSSSPSYLLSASIDGCVQYLEQEGTAAAERWFAALEDVSRRLQHLKQLQISENLPGVYAKDPSKLLISTAACALDGMELAEMLRCRFSIEVEMACPQFVLAMTGMGDDTASLSRLADALETIDALDFGKPPASVLSDTCLPESVLSLQEAVKASRIPVPLQEAAGRISAEYVWAYPPGIPLLAPGERIDAQLLQTVLTRTGLHSTYNGLPAHIFCIGKY